MNKLKRNDSGIWVMVAVPGEFAHPNANICYTGIGKVNAAIATRHIIDTENPRLILSLGTAGSSHFDYGEIVNVSEWVQRDMNTTEFLSPKFVVPGSSDAPIMQYGARDQNYTPAICGTGDTFVRNIAADIWNCVDMEGFAIAYAARASGVPFAAYKFISDGKSGDTSDREWSATLNHACTALHDVYERIIKKRLDS